MYGFVISLRRAAALGAAIGALAIGICGIPAAQAKTGSAGWQAVDTFTVPTGEQHGFFTYSCPTDLVARNGAFFPDPTLQTQDINLGVNAPRLDLGTGGYNSWGFEYNIPGGAPADATIMFNVYCTKMPI